MQPSELAKLKGLVQERQAQRETGQFAGPDAYQDLMARARQFFCTLPVPPTIKFLLGRVLGHYKGPYTS